MQPSDKYTNRKGTIRAVKKKDKGKRAGTRNASLGQVDKLLMQSVCREPLLMRAAVGCEDVVFSLFLSPSFPRSSLAFQETRENLADSLVLSSSTKQSKQDEMGGKKRRMQEKKVKPSEHLVAPTTQTHMQGDLHSHEGLRHYTFFHTKTLTSTSEKRKQLKHTIASVDFNLITNESLV